ncbi:cobyric acid synthase [Vibrio tubiashii]|uniref:Cobyric acid synthase n=1 Tax=Vibrio tubiashii ATCC 19109 TaxID=1051646 RepID=F9T023_9VIBR|nr:cobyric acid synthase [Vibrio tubiashii]AIW16254.1 cobalamin biosynthesis protein CobQ [Vibrio tubiashii ATCC 19109]EGU59101.1 cobyric acid synthase [Vibrio tubiashii ATCC 19109]EIF04779.1 cobyric acid synthase [Vibrio tubiashii NCIMB 1337 = ATCC 19106]
MQSTLKALMVQGTTSDAGKSVLVAGLCRVLARRNIKVAPFKPQNMALNSAVTPDGGEIGRAQAVQALASNIEPSVHMNPVLLKPNTDMGAQVIFQGKATTTVDAIGYQSYKKVALPVVMESFSILQSQYESVLIEGAGSPAEINLRANDIANMGFAEEADVPVIIVADIDRGGVFAHLYGTLALLSESEQARVKGFVINRFRGDISLLQPGLDWLEEKTGKPVIGVLPYLHGFDLEAEDAINAQQVSSENSKLNVVVPVFPRISNHTDFDTLRLNPDINLRYVGKGERLSDADLIILPGSKSVRNDLDYLRSQGWDKDINRHLRLGGKVMGICGGYQMLGSMIHDPLGIESDPGSSQGLGHLCVETELKQSKTLTNVSGTMTLEGNDIAVSGYEIHAGVSHVSTNHLIELENKQFDGTISDCNQVLGTYLHGIFDNADAVSAICKWVGVENVAKIDHQLNQQKAIDRIADAIEQHLDLKKLWPEL